MKEVKLVERGKNLKNFQYIVHASSLSPVFLIICYFVSSLNQLATWMLLYATSNFSSKKMKTLMTYHSVVEPSCCSCHTTLEDVCQC